jgi:hypothetical protein
MMEKDFAAEMFPLKHMPVNQHPQSAARLSLRSSRSGLGSSTNALRGYGTH